MHEVRQVHSLAMSPVWQVAPHPDATDREGLGYPLIIVLKQQRSAYLAALQRADDGDYGPLGEILARAMYDNLNRFIVPSLAGPARLVPLAALVDKDLSLAALRQAAQRGRLDAVQSADSVWRSTRTAVEEYRARGSADAQPKLMVRLTCRIWNPQALTWIPDESNQTTAPADT
jgi:hypothetical protein